MRDIALLYSGGLDSFVAYHHARALDVAVTPVFVHLGHPHNDREARAIAEQGIGVVALSLIGAPPPVLPGGVIPGRNLLLATIAAQYGGEVWLSALHGEMHPYTNRDKSHEFFLMASAVLTYSFHPVRPTTIVTSPFMDRTKADVVAHALQLGLTPADLAFAWSCYTDGDVPCGECKGCLHRWIAYTLNGIREVYARHPPRSTVGQLELEACKRALLRGEHDHYDERRCRDTIKAFDLDAGDVRNVWTQP